MTLLATGISDVQFHFDMSKCGYVIVLDTPLAFTHGDCLYLIEQGYASNGMSVPKFLWSIISPQYNPQTLLPSIVHDWLYGHGVMTRIEADRWYRDALMESGYSHAKAQLVYDALRMFGKSHWKNPIAEKKK